jgi:hypothetical protein
MKQSSVSNRARGSILIVACIVALVFLVLGATLHTFVIGEAHACEQQRDQLQALALAEAGLERAVSDLRSDLANATPTGGWNDGLVNGLACPDDTAHYYVVPYAQTGLGSGSYSVEFRNVANESDEIWVRATGFAQGQAQAVQAYVKGQSISCWDNAIFAGGSQTGLLINGNVQIAGSVHILGEGLAPDDLAMDMSGGAAILNNLAGMPAVLKAKINPIASATFNGQSVESLHAALRVRHGQVGLSGTANAGNPDATGNTVKETLDGVYVTDGFAGNKGASAVHSDNGAETAYDLGDEMQFPLITAPFQSEPSYFEWLRKQALVIEDTARLNVLASLTPATVFSYVDPMGKGSISCDGKGNLTINGIIYIGGNLGVGSTNKADTFNYTGRGSIAVLGSVTIDANFLAAGANTFPGTNIIGIMAAGNITFTGSQRDAMGLFYAQGKITSTKQTDVVGSFVSSCFDMGKNVPAIFYVPIPKNCFPPGLIGTEPVVSMSIIDWQRVDPPGLTSTYTEE